MKIIHRVQKTKYPKGKPTEGTHRPLTTKEQKITGLSGVWVDVLFNKIIFSKPLPQGGFMNCKMSIEERAEVIETLNGYWKS